MLFSYIDIKCVRESVAYCKMYVPWKICTHLKKEQIRRRGLDSVFYGICISLYSNIVFVMVYVDKLKQ